MRPQVSYARALAEVTGTYPNFMDMAGEVLAADDAEMIRMNQEEIASLDLEEMRKEAEKHLDQETMKTVTGNSLFSFLSLSLSLSVSFLFPTSMCHFLLHFIPSFALQSCSKGVKNSPWRSAIVSFTV